MLDIVKTKTKI